MLSDSIKAIVDRNAPTEGVFETGIPGVQLYRISERFLKTPAVYTPRVCINVCGKKRVYTDGGTHIYDNKNFICCTMPVPVYADVPRASPQKPVMGISIEFETVLLRELIASISSTQRIDSNTEVTTPSPDGLAVGSITKDLEVALLRLLELFGDTRALASLGKSRLTEVYYVLLTGNLGPMLHRRFGDTHKIAETVCYLRDHISEQISIDELAKYAGMSRAVFYRHFKIATGQAPVQFIKQLRLNMAAMNLAAGSTPSETAISVGYNSPAQFSREFKRQFGKSPREWTADPISELPTTNT